jgi:hypothetical protein
VLGGHRLEAILEGIDIVHFEKQHRLHLEFLSMRRESLSHIVPICRRGRSGQPIVEARHADRIPKKLLEQLQASAHELQLDDLGARHVFAGPGKCLDEPRRDKVAAHHDHDWNRRRWRRILTAVPALGTTTTSGARVDEFGTDGSVRWRSLGPR